MGSPVASATLGALALLGPGRKILVDGVLALVRCVRASLLWSASGMVQASRSHARAGARLCAHAVPFDSTIERISSVAALNMTSKHLNAEASVPAGAIQT